MIRRKLQETIEARMFGGKAIIIIGARQVGDHSAQTVPLVSLK